MFPWCRSDHLHFTLVQKLKFFSTESLIRIMYNFKFPRNLIKSFELIRIIVIFFYKILIVLKGKKLIEILNLSCLSV